VPATPWLGGYTRIPWARYRGQSSHRMHHRVYRRGSVGKRQEHARLPGCSSQSSSKRDTIAHARGCSRQELYSTQRVVCFD
jgi:hypothetical protein